MAITWVGSSNLVTSNATTVSATTPASLQTDDLLIAFVFARSAITAPSGWTLLVQTATFGESNSNDQRLAAYEKDSVVSGDSSQALTWTQASSARMGVVYVAARGCAIAESDANVSEGTDYEIYPPELSATEANELHIVAGSTHALPSEDARTPDYPFLTTLVSGSNIASYRLAVAYRFISAGAISDPFVFDADFNADNELGGISIRLQEAEPPIPPVEGRASADGPLGTAETLGKYGSAARSAVDGPLQSPSVLTFFNFDALVAGRSPRYVCDLVLANSTKRVPISSWQATLQTDASCYGQIVIPIATGYIDDALDATHFVVYRRVILADGSPYDYEMVRAAVNDVQTYRGGTGESIVMSGYFAAFAANTNPSASFNRTLKDIRTYSTGLQNMRVRSAIDWTLRPGHRAFINQSTSFIVSFVNYYVFLGDEYMDVGGDI